MLDNSSASTSDLEVRFVNPEDASHIRALFKKIFNEEMSEAHWHWKYQRPQSEAVVVYKEDQLLAHYGGVGTDIKLEGKDSTAMQITDLMVDPDARHGVRSRSPFYLSGKKFLESTVGFDNDYLLSYGFPSERAMGLSVKLGFFTPVGRMLEVKWEVSSCSTSFLEKTVLINKTNFDEYAVKINDLWGQFQKLFTEKIICRKDAEFFKWRYLEHPSKEYTILMILNRITGSPIGLLVCRAEKERVFLMDLLGSSLNLSKLIGHALAITTREKHSVLATWCSDTFKNEFSVSGAVQRELPVLIPACTATKGPSPETQKNMWWFMPGDTDYL